MMLQQKCLCHLCKMHVLQGWGEQETGTIHLFYYTVTVSNAEGLNQLSIIYILEIDACGIWSMWNAFMSWGTRSQEEMGETSCCICWILIFKSMCYCEWHPLARTTIAGKMVPLKMILSSGFNVLFFLNLEMCFHFQRLLLWTVNCSFWEPRRNLSKAMWRYISFTQGERDMSTLPCKNDPTYLSSTQQFIRFYNDPNRFKGEEGWSICFLPTQDAFQMFCTFANIVQSISFKDMQPTIFSPDNCADMKKEGAALLFMNHFMKTSQSKQILFGCKPFFGIIAKTASCSIKNKTCWSPKPFSNSRSANDVRLGSSPPRRHHLLPRLTSVRDDGLLSKLFTGTRRTKLSFHLPRATFVWPWWNHSSLWLDIMVLREFDILMCWMVASEKSG